MQLQKSKNIKKALNQLEKLKELETELTNLSFSTQEIRENLTVALNVALSETPKTNRQKRIAELTAYGEPLKNRLTEQIKREHRENPVIKVLVEKGETQAEIEPKELQAQLEPKLYDELKAHAFSMFPETTPKTIYSYLDVVMQKLGF